MNKMLKKIAFTMLLAMAGVQSAFAVCAGEVYFKAPANWEKAYVYLTFDFTEMTPVANGFFYADLSKASQQSWGDEYMKFEMTSSTTYPAYYSNASEWNGFDQFIVDPNKGDILCPGEGQTLYIYENPAEPGKTVVSSEPPNAKYFFVMIPPDMDSWMSGVPMISTDGGVTGKPMTAVADMCGWYSYVFFNEEISDNIVLYRNDDELREDMLGLNGNWEMTAGPTPIPLNMMFAMGIDSLFFVPDEEQKDNTDGFYYHAADVEGIEGTCSYSLAAIIYDTDASLHPAFSCYVDAGMGTASSKDCQVGVDNATANIHVAQASALAAVKACIGVTPGIVQEFLDSDKKPHLTDLGKTCFISDALFDMLFENTPGVNEMTCYDLPFGRAADGKWEFDSDFYTSSGLSVQGGFYPVETTTDADVIAAGSIPLWAARNKHAAEGPVFHTSWWRQLDEDENATYFDLLCNSSSWRGGIDCAGKFADGNDLKKITYRGVDFSDVSDDVWCWGSYCANEAPANWPFYAKDSETPVARTMTDATPRWISGNYMSADVSDPDGRNQQFCFESHAQFTYSKGLRFNFRGDDDIWVYIDNRLAVDLGGTHLAAPAYVNLDAFLGSDGNNLVPGQEYDIDIFFCDRRTTMSNVRIKTNMYIRQKTAVNLRKTTNADGVSSYDVCYTKSGDGSCAAALGGSKEGVTLCGSELSKNYTVSYTLVAGRRINDPAVPGFESVTEPGVYKCGIDLTDLTAPKVKDDALCLGAGRYSLFMNVDGKSQKVASFRIAGSNVSVVYRDAVAKDTNSVAIPGGSYKLTTSAVGGELVPVYVSYVEEPENSGDPLEIYPFDAVGIAYTLSYDEKMNVYYKDADGNMTQLASGQMRVVGASGIDTLYATVPMADLTESVQTFKIKVPGNDNSLSLSYYLPKIYFVKEIPADGASPVTQSGMTPESDGSYEELWVGALYDLYVGIFRPDENGTYRLCKQECDGVKLYKGDDSSPKIQFVSDTVSFKDGYATVTVKSLKSYRYDHDPDINNPATVAVELNDAVWSLYSPIYFREAPVPIPSFADVFDVRGSLPSTEYNIPLPYFDMNQEYLDGIGDSVAIYFNRPLHKDSLPSKVCVVWDSSIAKTYNPNMEGFSSIAKDTLVYCNFVSDVGLGNINPSADGYTRVASFGGVDLSADVKTSGTGKVVIYAEFEDKGKKVKQGFSAALLDRIAPVPLRADVRHIEGSDYDSLVVMMSEPVHLVTNSYKTNALDFYMNSATGETESDRYMSALTKTKVNAADAPVLGTRADGTSYIKYIYNSKDGGYSPQQGDYVRLGGDLANIIWEDDSTTRHQFGSDTLRAKVDAEYYWNSPTGYSETKRLPSPWVAVVRSKSGIPDDDSDVDYAKPSFRLKMVGPFKFAIVMNDSVSTTPKSYAVMDLQGRVVQQGNISSTETVVPALSSGSYVVRVGLASRRVNVR